jgi:hypothetical protein
LEVFIENVPKKYIWDSEPKTLENTNLYFSGTKQNSKQVEVNKSIIIVTHPVEAA